MRGSDQNGSGGDWLGVVEWIQLAQDRVVRGILQT
jgi:hypothetical protein